MATEDQDTIFETTSGEASYTRNERIKQQIDLTVLAPLRIMKEDYRAVLGLTVVVGFLLLGTLGVVVIPAPEQNEGPRLAQPGEEGFVLGTDAFGNDMVKMLVHATPAMLKMILAGAVFATIVATVVGTVAGYKRGTVETVAMTISDIAMTIPGLPLIIVLAMALQPRDPAVVGLLLSVNAWAGLARTIHSEVLSLRTNNYVESSRLMGVPTRHIIYSDILPNIMPYVLINFMSQARNVIFASVGLYFLGVLPFTTLNWGVMMNLAYNNNALLSWQATHWLVLPMFVITLLTFGLILLSQGLDRVFNPRVRARHASTVDTESDTGIQ